MNTKTLDQIHSEVVRLSVLLKVLRSALPDDAIGCKVDTRFLVGWAYDMAEQAANDIDFFDIHQAPEKKGDGNEE